jgi:hypothetical protein
MKLKTSELIRHALNWAVAKCVNEGGDPEDMFYMTDILSGYFSPSTNWSQGGPIIEREEIDTYCHESPKSGCGWWVAEITGAKAKGRGNSPLEAAMRCYVASKLGAEVEIPEELK